MRIAVAALAIGAMTTVPVAAATPVASSSASPISLGTFAAGHYHITATGSVDLAGGSGFTVNPDGTPVTSITTPGYGYCNPSGCDYDAPGSSYGVGGPGRNLGAVLGTLTASPSGPGSYFLIGNGADVFLPTAGDIYAQVNDTFYPNNVGSFSLDVTAVPEPATWGLFIAGFGMLGASVRRQRAFG